MGTADDSTPGVLALPPVPSPYEVAACISIVSRVRPRRRRPPSYLRFACPEEVVIEIQFKGRASAFVISNRLPHVIM